MDHRRSVVQAPAQSKVSYEARTGSPGHDHVASWKIPRTETAQPLWASMFDCPHGGQCFSLHPVWTPVSIYTLSVSHLPPFAAVKSVACLLDDILIGMGEAALRFPEAFEAFSSSSWTNPEPPIYVDGTSQVYVGGKGEWISMSSKPYEKQSDTLLLWSHIIIPGN